MDFSSIRNYYEQLVIDYLQTELIPEMEDPTSDFILDVTCYALTKLPTRYLRHGVDMAFYLPGEERRKMASEVKVAVDDAYQYILKKIDRNN
jgi:hypothetical protein